MFKKFKDEVSFCTFRMIYCVSVLIFLFPVIVSGVDVPLQILKASEIYQKEREQIKNYKVDQDVTTNITEQKTLSVVIEKRKQIGYFIIPNKYYFVITEKKINGVRQEIYGNFEKAERTKIIWLSKEGLRTYRFQEIGSHSDILKYSVTPLNKTKNHIDRGQIWIHSKTGRIKKMIQEPIQLKKGTKKYIVELNFDKEYEFQEPSESVLTAVVSEKEIDKEIKVFAKFQNYNFNVLIPSELLKP